MKKIALTNFCYLINYFCLREILFCTYFKPHVAYIGVCSGGVTSYLLEI